MQTATVHTLMPILTTCLTFAASGLQAQEGWVPLFNGKDLSGWTQKGGQAKVFVDQDCIVGEAVTNTPNSFLCTDKDYANFILELDVKVDPRLNSGVQIRSECFDHETKVNWSGQTIEIPANRVHGYQVEIDPDPVRNRWWSAGVYDEARRLWLYPGQLGGDTNFFTWQGRQIFKQDGWNKLRVVAVGDSIKTYLNGVLCADLKDSMTPKGFIALQVHGVGSNTSLAGVQVRFRNVRLLPLGPAPVSEEGTPPNTLTRQEQKEGWKLLWDGKTTAGWRSPKSDDFPKKSWQLKDGELRVVASGNAEAMAGGDIITLDQFSNFDLKVDFKTTPGCNSGIKYFVHPNLDPITGTGAKASAGSAIGYEYQILDDERHPDAKLGRDGNRTLGSFYDLLPAAPAKTLSPIGEWNTARIVVHGNHGEHWLNGRKILEYDRTSPEFRNAFEYSKFKGIAEFPKWTGGHILLQEHGSQVSFKNIKIRSLGGE